MPDLNEWQLTAGADTLIFGFSETSEYPFKSQVTVSEVDRETQDAAHPSTDGVLMGRDLLRGFTLQFDSQILREHPLTATPWNSALDLYSAFAAKWRADSVRLTPGEYASLANLERERLVYGRPRGIAPKLAMTRKGYLDFQFDFETNGPDFYDITEKVATITPVPASSGKITSPLVSPITTTTGTEDVAETVNEGDLAAWPIIEFHGPGTASSVELFDGTDRLWVLKVPDRIRFDQVLTVDTRPWKRGATLNGAPANGLLRGDRLFDCRIPVGTFDIRYKVKDTTGVAHTVIRWRDTYASL